MSPRAAREWLGIVIVLLGAFAVWVTPAGAVVAETAGGPASYLPLNGAAGSAGVPLHSAIPEGEPPLEYHGGPVMHSQTAYAIFWAPGGESDFPPGYIAGIEKYLEDVGEDSGKPTNVYSVSAQYTETGGEHATYNDSFGGSVIDEHPYPLIEACPPYEGFTGVEYTSCITDEQLASEVQIEITAKSWPHGLGAEYYVVLPPEVGSCFGSEAESGCFDEEFCAYHSYRGTPEPEPVPSTVAVYANISYSPGDVFGCGVGEYPNGHANGNLDDTLSSLSHEANESITDPTLEAWFDFKGFENGDECRNTKDSDDYGEPLGGSFEAEDLFNEEIGTGHYYLQQEWSNDTEECEQRVDPAQPAIGDPGEVTINQSAAFSSAGTVAGAGGISSYHWDFGDSGTSSAANPSHTFTSLGTFPVELTVTDDGGFTYSTEREVTVLPPAQLPEASSSPATSVTAATATLNGSVNPMGRKTTYRFEFGPTTAYGSSTPAAGAGSGASSSAVSAGIAGLSSSTTYHFRLVATNAAGTERGADEVFTTAAVPPAPPPPGRQGTAVVGGVRVRHGSAFVKLSCQGGPCKGSLSLTVRVRIHGHAKVRSIGGASFTIAAGDRATIAVRLNGLGRKLLAAAGRRGVKVTLTGKGIAPRSLVLKKS